MSQASFSSIGSENHWTAADLVAHWGPIPLHRICMNPGPGSATEEDLIRMHDHDNRLFELVDATLVEKDMGTYESYLAIRIAFYLGVYLEQRPLGIVLGEAGFMRFRPGLVRAPDVSFISNERLHKIQLKSQPIASLVPDLAVEVISKGNTTIEMERKLFEYFERDVAMVWYIYPNTKSAIAYTSPIDFEHISSSGVLHGGCVLPDFELRLDRLFEV